VLINISPIAKVSDLTIPVACRGASANSITASMIVSVVSRGSRQRVCKREKRALTAGSTINMPDKPPVWLALSIPHAQCSAFDTRHRDMAIFFA
jgi:hypothetical protein